MQLNLPLLALDPRWIEESPTFDSPNGDIVRGGILLLIAAFTNTVGGTLPMDDDYLARKSGLGAAKWALNQNLMLRPFVEIQYEGGARYQHQEMAKVLAAVQDRFGAQMAELAASSVFAVQATEEFELTGALAPAASRAKGKTALPKDFTFSPPLLEHARKEGYQSSEELDWLLMRFKDMATSKDLRYKDWSASARNFMGSRITVGEFRERFGFFPRENRAGGLRPAVVPVRQAGGHSTFERQARDGGEASMQLAMMAHARSGAPVGSAAPSNGAQTGTTGFGGFNRGARA